MVKEATIYCSIFGAILGFFVGANIPYLNSNTLASFFTRSISGNTLYPFTEDTISLGNSFVITLVVTFCFAVLGLAIGSIVDHFRKNF